MLSETMIVVSPYVIGTAVGAGGVYVAENQSEIDQSVKGTAAKVASMIRGESRNPLRDQYNSCCVRMTPNIPTGDEAHEQLTSYLPGES